MSAADEIKKLKELLDAGAISQDEYDNEKARLLHTKDNSGAAVVPPPVVPPLPVLPANKKRGCLVPVIVILIIFAVGLSVALVQAARIEKENASVEVAEEIEAEKTPEEIMADDKAFDERTWKDFGDLYVAHNKLTNAVTAYAESRITQLNLYNFCEELEKYLIAKSTTFEYGETDEQIDYLSEFKSFALEDKMAVSDLMKYLDNSEISVLSSAQEHLVTAKDAALIIASNRKILLEMAGYTEDEIETKITADLAKLDERITGTSEEAEN